MQSRSGFDPQPQVDAGHYRSSYASGERWSSYWCQIEEALNLDGDRLLEIGVGDGVVANYLGKVLGKQLTTLDIDSELAPDVIADIVHMPFQDDEFDVAMACEVLEHMPLDRVNKALVEMRRVARTSVISVPDQSRYFFQGLLYYGPRPKRKRIFNLDISRLFSRPPEFGTKVPLHKEHYWELNRGSMRVSDLISMMEHAGWHVEDHYRNRDCPYHHFFVLS